MIYAKTYIYNDTKIGLVIKETRDDISWQEFDVPSPEYLHLVNDVITIKTQAEIDAEKTLELASIVRRERDMKLKIECDSITTLIWNSMIATKQQEWVNYRQALLDLPLQPGFPMNITWPVKPI